MSLSVAEHVIILMLININFINVIFINVEDVGMARDSKCST